MHSPLYTFPPYGLPRDGNLKKTQQANKGAVSESTTSNHPNKVCSIRFILNLKTTPFMRVYSNIMISAGKGWLILAVFIKPNFVSSEDLQGTPVQGKHCGYQTCLENLTITWKQYRVKMSKYWFSNNVSKKLLLSTVLGCGYFLARHEQPFSWLFSVSQV